jgi:hypothetical protein
MAGQPGALENVKYMTQREFQQAGGARLSTAGQDVGNRNKVITVKYMTSRVFSSQAIHCWSR